MARRKKAELVRLLLSLLPTASSTDWMPVEDLAALAGVGRRTAENGIRAARRQLTEMGLREALVSGPLGYRLTLDATEINTFRVRQCRSGYTSIESAWVGAVKPWLNSLGDARQTQLAQRSFGRALEDIEDLITHAS